MAELRSMTPYPLPVLAVVPTIKNPINFICSLTLNAQCFIFIKIFFLYYEKQIKDLFFKRPKKCNISTYFNTFFSV
jgi:hypothetical protein